LVLGQVGGTSLIVVSYSDIHPSTRRIPSYELVTFGTSVLQYNLRLTRPCSPFFCISSATPGFRLALFLLPSYLANGFPYSVSPLVHRCTPRTLLLLCRRSSCRDCCRRGYSLDSAVFPPVFVLFKGSPALKTSGRGPRRFGRDRRSLLPLRFPRSAQQLHLCSCRWLFENARSSPFGSACHDVADLFDGHALHVSIVFVHSLRQASPARTVLLPSKSWVPFSS
jgi:hypothetical protein